MIAEAKKTLLGNDLGLRRVQFKYFAAVLGITEVRVGALVLHTVLCITSHHKVVHYTL